MDKEKRDRMKELQGQLRERRSKLKEVFDQAGSDMDMSAVTVLDGDSAAKVDRIRAMNEEIDDIAQELEPLEQEAATLQRAKREADQFADQRRGHPLPPRQAGDDGGAAAEIAPPPSIADEFFDAGGLDAMRGRDVELADFDIQATLFQTGDGWEPEVVRGGRFVDKVTRPIQIMDLIPSGTTTQPAVKFMEETVLNNNAAETAEGGAYKEVELEVKERESAAKKITVWLPVTDEQFEDVPQARGYINRRLPFMLRQRLDYQIPNGNGEGNNLLGLLNREGVQSQAKGTDPVPDATYKAMTKTEVGGGAMVGPVIYNPYDWEGIRLLRTSEGVYIWGSPADAGPERIWGQRAVKAQAMPEGTALTGDFANFSELAFRAELEMKLSDSHGEKFVEGVLAIRARIRVALVIYRPAAFVEITGLKG